MCDVAKVRELNDYFRSSLTGGRVLITQGVSYLPNVEEALRAVRRFTDFNDDNDPYGEHDFGAIEVGDATVFWKIDYYSNDMLSGSPDAAIPSVTARVLTVMLANEY